MLIPENRRRDCVGNVGRRTFSELLPSFAAVLALVAAGASTGFPAPSHASSPALEILEEPAAQLNRIYQREKNGGYTKPFTIKVVDGSDVNIESQIIKASDGAVERKWMGVGSTHQGTGTFSIPFPDGSHFVKFRKAGDSLGPPVQSINRIGVGDNELMIGQSGMRNFSSLLGRPYPVALPLPSSSDIRNLRRYSGHGYFDPTERIKPTQFGPGTNEPVAGATHPQTGGNGLLEYLRKAQEARGYPVGAYFFPVGGSSLDSWIPGGSNFDGMAKVLDAPGGPGWAFTRLHIFGGEASSIKHDSAERVAQLYVQIIDAIRKKADRPDLPVHISLLGPLNTRPTTDESSETVRQAQWSLPGRRPNVQVALNKLDQPLSDDFAHHTPIQHEQQAHRWLQNVLFLDHLAPNGCQGPRGVKATVERGGTDIVIDVRQDGGKTLVDRVGNPAGTGLSAFEILRNGQVLSPTAASLDRGRVKLQFTGLNAQPNDLLRWRYMYGERPDIANVVYDDTSPRGDPQGCPMQPSRGWEAVTVKE